MGVISGDVVARVLDHPSQFTCLEILHPKTEGHVNPSVEVRHLVAKFYKLLK